MSDGSNELPERLQSEPQTVPQPSDRSVEKIAEGRNGQAPPNLLPAAQDTVNLDLPVYAAANHTENGEVQNDELVRNNQQAQPVRSAVEHEVDIFQPNPSNRIQSIESLIDAVALATHEEYLAAGDLGHEADEPEPKLLSPLIDLVRRDSGDPRIYVCLFKSFQDFFSSPAIEYDGRWRHVPQLPPGLQKSLLLPTRLKNYGTTRQLFDDICALLQQHAPLFENQCKLLAYWSLASWFPDFLPFVPRLTITGPPFAADLLLRVLRSVCRRPVSLAAMSPAVLRAIPFDELMPTLLIREERLSKKMAALLDASDQSGYLVVSGKDMRQFYCAKCLYLGEDGNGMASRLPGIHVHVTKNRSFAVRALPSADVTQDLQNRLFSYRAVNHDHVESSMFGVSGFMPEFCAVARALGAPIVDDPELQTGIIELLKEQNDQAQVDRASGLNAIVLRAVLSHCHQGDQQQAFVREIATTVNQIYKQEGESLKVSNESVGHVLRNLGLYTRRLGSTGRGLTLDNAMRLRTHELAYAHQVIPDSIDPPLCGYCHNLQTSQRSQLM
jgi:hypothetical protein